MQPSLGVNGILTEAHHKIQRILPRVKMGIDRHNSSETRLIGHDPRRLLDKLHLAKRSYSLPDFTGAFLGHIMSRSFVWASGLCMDP
jgi:hypothetical protein